MLPWILALIAASSLVSAPLHASTQAVSAQAGPTVLVLGDSISAAYGIQREAGWVALLDQRLREHSAGAKVVNASISGETSGGGRARLGDAMALHDPSIVIIELGGNDGLRGYPTKRLEENLAAMVEMVQAENRTAILVGMQIPPNYGIRYTRAFQQVFHDVAERYQTAFVPFLLDEVALAKGMMQSDGIHPTAEAQSLMLDAVWPVLEPHLTP